MTEVTMQKFETEYPKEVLEVGLFVGAILEATGKALEDGFQPGDDIPEIIASPLSELMKAVQGIKDMPEAFKQLPVKSSMAIVAPIAEGVETLVQSLRKE